MKHLHLGTVTIEDIARADCRAARLEEIERHGRPVEGRTMTFRSKKHYDRNQFKKLSIYDY